MGREGMEGKGRERRGEGKVDGRLNLIAKYRIC